MQTRTGNPVLLDQKNASYRRLLGQAGEQAATDMLCAKGFRVRDRNWRQGSLELDMVCLDADTLVFVEVRTRVAGGLVSPVESMTPAKRRTFIKAARTYLTEKGLWDMPCRFDAVFAVAHAAHPPFDLELEHVADVIQLCEAVDCRHTSW